jgi:hypothetical protein
MRATERAGCMLPCNKRPVTHVCMRPKKQAPPSMPRQLIKDRAASPPARHLIAPSLHRDAANVMLHSGHRSSVVHHQANLWEHQALATVAKYWKGVTLPEICCHTGWRYICGKAAVCRASRGSECILTIEVAVGRARSRSCGMHAKQVS